MYENEFGLTDPAVERGGLEGGVASGFCSAAVLLDAAGEQ